MSISAITEKQNRSAIDLCSRMRDENMKKTAYINFAGGMFFADYMLEKGFIATTKRSIFNSARLYQDFEIIDVYCNYHRIYVLTTDNKNRVKISVKHKKYNVLPEAYAVVYMNLSTNTVEFMGMIDPSEIDYSIHEGLYYTYNLDNIRSKEEFYGRIEHYGDKTHTTGRHIECINLFDYYVNFKLDDKNKAKLISHILTCESCKKKLTEKLEASKTAELKQEIPSRRFVENSYNPKQEIPSRHFIENYEEPRQEAANKTSSIKSVIDVIYKEKPVNNINGENFTYNFAIRSDIKKMSIIAGSVFLILLVLTTFALNMASSKKKSLESEPDIVYENRLDERFENSANYDIKFSPIKKIKGYAIVQSVSWEIPSSVTKEEQKEFLQQTGKTIRLNLQNDLLLSNESLVNSKVKFEIRFLRDGNIDEITPVQSSGSDAVDEIIKQSIKNTMHYIRPPKGSFIGKRNAITLVIEF